MKIKSTKKQTDFDMLMLDIRMDASFVKESMQLKWVAETGFVENIQKITKEFKIARNLIVNGFIFYRKRSHSIPGTMFEQGEGTVHVQGSLVF